MKAESVVLQYADSKAKKTKEYRLQLTPARIDQSRWEVSFEFGSTGHALRRRTKTPEAVDYQEAAAIYQRALRQKLRQGYRIVDSNHGPLTMEESMRAGPIKSMSSLFPPKVVRKPATSSKQAAAQKSKTPDTGGREADMPGRTIREWQEGPVDLASDHFEISYGEGSFDKTQEWFPVALVGCAPDGSFNLEFLIDREAPGNSEILTAVRKDLNFYIRELHERNPWAYMKYHCSTMADLYGNVHWNFVPKKSSKLRRGRSGPGRWVAKLNGKS